MEETIGRAFGRIPEMNEDYNKIRRKIVETAYNSGEGHIASSLSIVELLYVLYNNILTGDDYFILSKGHASLGLYSTLNHFGYITDEELKTFCKDCTLLPGHPDRIKLPCVCASTGSLGHGLPIGVGIAMGLKASCKKGNVYVLVGDGEMNEGSILEAVNLAAYHKLDNLCCIVDCNGSADRALTTHLPRVFHAFGWMVDEVSGHNPFDVQRAAQMGNVLTGAPKCVVAITVKGCGVSFIEGSPHEWHHKALSKEQYLQAMEELKCGNSL